MNINFIAVTSLPRRDNTVVVDLTKGLLKPSVNLTSSISKNKTSEYVKEMTTGYTATENQNVVRLWTRIHNHMKGRKTVYLLVNKGCEKWMMDGFKSFYKTIHEALEIVQNPKPMQ